jgi:hypothetical protein
MKTKHVSLKKIKNLLFKIFKFKPNDTFFYNFCFIVIYFYVSTKDLNKYAEIFDYNESIGDSSSDNKKVHKYQNNKSLNILQLKYELVNFVYFGNKFEYFCDFFK